jgi:tetratricopeptide (TPR) repeat protein
MNIRSAILSAAIWATVVIASASPELESAKTLYLERKDAEAKAAFELVAKSEPRNAQAPYYLGRLAMRARDADSAVKHFERAIALEPRNALYHLELGGAYGNKAQNAGLFGKASLAGKARNALEKAVEIDPRNIEARNGLVQFYSQAPALIGGGLDKAHAQADEIIKLDPARGRLVKAGLFAREKKFDDAFALYEDALRSAPDDYMALYQIGRLAAESGQRLELGLEALQRCLALPTPAGSPGHAPANWRLGNIWEKKGDKASARAAYEAALAIDSTFENARNALQRL